MMRKNPVMPKLKKKGYNSFRSFSQICITIIITLLLEAGCKKSPAPLFKLLKNTGVNFENTVIDNKVENSFQFRNFYNGGGVAIGDLNNDGLPDLVFTSNQGKNKIYINKGNYKFEDISSTCGFLDKDQWSTGVTLVDIDHDGWLDIYICHSGHVGTSNRQNELYRNNHNGTFTECASKYGLDHSGFSTQAVFFDYDLDGDLDCLIIDNSPIPFGSLNYAGLRDSSQASLQLPKVLRGGGNHLFRNDNGHYTEVTQAAGLHTSPISFGLGVTVADINGDGYPDIYVGNDFLERDYLYINQKDGTFRDELTNQFQHISMSSMGVDIGDFNNDGYPDIYTTDMFPENDYRLKTTGTFDNIDLFRSKIKSGFYHQYVRNCLQMNTQNNHFVDIANFSGVAATDWSWGTVLFDADNDGLMDIYVCNGINRDLSNLDFLDFFSNGTYQEMLKNGNRAEATSNIISKIPRTPLLSKVYQNLGNLKFKDRGKDWGITQTSYSNSVAYGDLNNTGSLDLVINNENGPAFIYENQAHKINQNHFLAISARSKGENTFAIGTKIKVYIGKQILSREIEPVRGFQSSVDYKQLIGTGKAGKVDSMVVIWPDGQKKKFKNPILNKTYFLVWEPIPGSNSISNSSSSSLSGPRTELKSTSFSIIPSQFEKHQENDFVDFYSEAGIPQMLSREGPKATVGDLNGDGLEDIFVSGALGQAGEFYFQNKEGSFTKKPEPNAGQFASFEETACLLFDADGDGNLDLFIGSGGNTVPAGTRELQHRLYKNDGKGNFTLDAEAFPLNQSNVSVAVAYDFDGDGDLDLFVGCRNTPGQYGVDPQSHIYINNGHGHFTEMGKSRIGPLSSLGMVTDAVWVTMPGDPNKELVVVGDWTYPRIFKYESGHFLEVKTNLNRLYGLWNKVLAVDVNRDGKMDLVLGNIGENFYLHPDRDHPVKLWLNDFNQNGHLDKILTYSPDGRDMPIILKNDMEAAIPFLKKQSLLHEDYAKKSIQDLFSPEMIKSSSVKYFNYTSSIIAINRGRGQFKIEKLPDEAQFSSIHTALSLDINQDGFPDIVVGGNDFDFIPQFGRLDGNLGQVFLNDGSGSFNPISGAKTGLLQRGEARDLRQILIKNSTCLLWLDNDEAPSLYKLNKK